MRSYVKTGIVDEIRAAGGEVFGITSEPHSLASEAEQAWELPFSVIGDPHHEIRQQCKEKGWLEVFYNKDYGHLRARSWASHPNGYYQPAVLTLDKSERVLYRWRCVPKFDNMSGAGARPEAIYTWQKIKEGLKEVDDAPLDQTPEMGAKELSWFRFLLIMTAHGWFIRPKAFPLQRNGDKDQVSPTTVMPRVYMFLAFWALLFFLLPITWFGLSFLTWFLAYIPGLVEIHRQFQNEPDPY